MISILDTLPDEKASYYSSPPKPTVATGNIGPFAPVIPAASTTPLHTDFAVEPQTLNELLDLPVEKVEVPNVALVYWAGEMGGIGKQWAGYNDDRGTLRRRGFKVDEQSGMTGNGLTTHIATGMQNKKLHGMYYWGHGFQRGGPYGAITDHYAAKKSAKAWDKYDKAYDDWDNNGQQGAAPIAPKLLHPSAYVLRWNSINPPYKFGFAIFNTCFSDNPESRSLISGNGIFYGHQGLLIPTPFFIGRKSVADVITPGAQGTQK